VLIGCGGERDGAAEMIKKLGGSVAGVALAMLILLAVERLDSALYPLSAGLDARDPGDVAQLIMSMPFVAKLIVVFGWLAGSFAGAWIALRITDWRWSAWVVAAVILTGGIANIVQIPHPLWMQICAVIVPLAGARAAIGVHRKPYPGEPLLG